MFSACACLVHVRYHMHMHKHVHTHMHMDMDMHMHTHMPGAWPLGVPTPYCPYPLLSLPLTLTGAPSP